MQFVKSGREKTKVGLPPSLLEFGKHNIDARKVDEAHVPTSRHVVHRPIRGGTAMRISKLRPYMPVASIMYRESVL